MEVSINKYNQPIEGNTGIHPKKFMMMLAMVSMTMMFIALTSALLVKKGDTVKWMNFSLPPIFLVSTLVIILSSVTIQWSYKFYIKGQDPYKLLLLATLALSIVFSILQYIGWQQIKAIGFPFNGNVSGSFVYVITGFHLAHLVGGIIAIFITWVSHARKLSPLDELKRIADVNRKVNMEILLMFWHFLGGLWIYLCAFLYIVYNI